MEGSWDVHVGKSKGNDGGNVVEMIRFEWPEMQIRGRVEFFIRFGRSGVREIDYKFRLENSLDSTDRSWPESWLVQYDESSTESTLFNSIIAVRINQIEWKWNGHWLRPIDANVSSSVSQCGLFSEHTMITLISQQCQQCRSIVQLKKTTHS